ncbi:MAG: response regulator transcription factor [Hyphomicrobiales bacterium]|nr:response regulator transcription factor [Hyphomicrobiales bacterium]
MRVLVVDDHPIVISGCRAMLAGETDVEVIEAADAETGYARFCADQPDLVVADINLPGASGFELTRRVLKRDPHARVIIFSMNEDAGFAARAIECGARGFLTKNDDPDLFVEAVRAVANGGQYLPPRLAERLAFQRNAAQASPLADLTPREEEILRLLGHGRALAEIADAVGVSYKTVANTCALLKRKLRARTSADLVRMAVERRLT